MKISTFVPDNTQFSTVAIDFVVSPNTLKFCIVKKFGSIIPPATNKFASVVITFPVGAYLELYVNFVGPLLENESIKFTCRNRGHCCNINHLIKVTKEDKQKATEKKIQKEQEELKRSFTIDFD